MASSSHYASTSTQAVEEEQTGGTATRPEGQQGTVLGTYLHSALHGFCVCSLVPSWLIGVALAHALLATLQQKGDRRCIMSNGSIVCLEPFVAHPRIHAASGGHAEALGMYLGRSSMTCRGQHTQDDGDHMFWQVEHCLH